MKKNHINKRVAFCGTRGLPANYGGFETAVDEITREFIINGYDVDVFSRLSSYKTELSSYGGRNLVYVKGSKSSKLDTFVSSIQTGIFLIKNRKKYDYIFWFNNANFPGILLTLLTRIPFSVNTDGLEWRRSKWTAPFKAYYFISTLIISILCKNLISDSKGIQEYYKKVFNKKTTFIPYGSPDFIEIDELKEENLLKKYQLEKNKYFLQITRFEPENNPLEIINSFKDSLLYKEGYKMILVGYKDSNEYSDQIKALDNKYGISVLNSIYDKDTLAVLRKNCFSYVHGNSVGGTNPALLEAMVYCKRILAIDINFSRDVLGAYGTYFNSNNLQQKFQDILLSEELSTQLKERAARNYNWQNVSKSYMRMVEGKSANYEDFLNKDLIEKITLLNS